MKLLLTSAGIKNPSLHDALLDLLGKPIDEASALCVTTASYAMSNGTEMGRKRLASAGQPSCAKVARPDGR